MPKLSRFLVSTLSGCWEIKVLERESSLSYFEPFVHGNQLQCKLRHVNKLIWSKYDFSTLGRTTVKVSLTRKVVDEFPTEYSRSKSRWQISNAVDQFPTALKNFPLTNIQHPCKWKWGIEMTVQGARFICHFWPLDSWWPKIVTYRELFWAPIPALRNQLFQFPFCLTCSTGLPLS